MKKKDFASEEERFLWAVVRASGGHIDAFHPLVVYRNLAREKEQKKKNGELTR